jgi:ubiquinone/menaquinone biosynthesis C-methylase UbiE
MNGTHESPAPEPISSGARDGEGTLHDGGALYTHGHHESVLRSHRWRTAENSAAYLIPSLAAGMSLLDVGCGPGTITIDLARLVTPGRVLGIDRSEEAVAAASALPAERSGVSFEAVDLFAMPFGDGTFDVVHAHQVLQHLDDPVAALIEMRRVCHAGGLVAARDGDYASMTWYPEYPELARWLDLYRRTARANGGEPDAGRRLLGWAHAAGFDEVSPSASAWCFATPDDRRWWAETWAERITVSALARRIVELGFATPDELAGIGQAWLRWATEPDGWFSIVHGEVLCRPG